MPTQSERREHTRAELLRAARNLFGMQGYTATKMDDVAEQAGVAKGALYHHFKTKMALFEAVLTIVSGEIAMAAQLKASTAPNLIESMRSGVRAFFDLCSTPSTSQILLKDGPAVLGWDKWREIDSRNFGGIVKMSLTMGMETGILKPQPVDPLSHLLIGAISEAAMSCAAQDSFERAAEEYITGLDTLMLGLLKT